MELPPVFAFLNIYSLRLTINHTHKDDWIRASGGGWVNVGSSVVISCKSRTDMHNFLWHCNNENYNLLHDEEVMLPTVRPRIAELALHLIEG